MVDITAEHRRHTSIAAPALELFCRRRPHMAREIGTDLGFGSDDVELQGMTPDDVAAAHLP